MSQPLSDTTTSDEPEWLAIRYVLGELATDEAAAFELRLDTDQSARDALVRATRLVATVATTSIVSRQPVVPRLPWRRRTFAMLAATAATLLAGTLALQSWFAEPPIDGVPVASGDIDPARLATLWSQSGETLNGVSDFVSIDEFSADDSDVDPSDVLLPPDWMLAAVEQESWPSPMDSPLDGDADAIERN